LGHDEIHVWTVSLEVDAETVSTLGELLNDDERARSERFRRPGSERTFVVTRAAIRDILGRYLSVDPRRVQIGSGPHGKPQVAGEFGCLPIRFNVAHTGSIALCAVTIGREIGIDAEVCRPVTASAAVADCLFSPAERLALQALPDRRRDHAFLSCWTRKEAYLKALGVGLSAAPQECSVGVAPDQTPKWVESSDPTSGSHWCVQSFTPQDGHIGAVSWHGPVSAWRWWSWSRRLVVESASALGQRGDRH
jgi:4'-phosphopantetheinyl transferase